MAWFHLHRHLRNAFIPTAVNNYHPHAIRQHMLGAYVVILVLVKVGAVAFVSFTSPLAKQSEITPTNIIRLSNNERRALQIPVLKSNAALSKAAQAKGNDMLRAQYFAHVSPNNVSPWFWFTQAGYRYQYAGENLAIDFVESENVVQAWMASPSHRKNLVNSKFKEIGVAVVSGTFNGADSVIVVQMFGTPPPEPVRRVAQGPAQQPAPAEVKQKLAQVVPSVLGEEETEPILGTPVVISEPVVTKPPVQPIIHTPAAGSLVRVATPEVVGTAEPGSRVIVKANDRAIGQTTASAQGVFSLVPSEELLDGQYTFRAESVARNLSSSSNGQTVTLDTRPPEVNAASSFALLSLVAPDTYDVQIATTSDATEVRCSCGAISSNLESSHSGYHGTVTLDPRKTSSSLLRLNVRDAAGNETGVALADTSLFTTGVVASSGSSIVTAFEVLSLSRAVMTFFLVAMLIIGLINVFVHLERQHHASIIGTMLVMYLAGSLLLL